MSIYQLVGTQFMSEQTLYGNVGTSIGFSLDNALLVSSNGTGKTEKLHVERLLLIFTVVTASVTVFSNTPTSAPSPVPTPSPTAAYSQFTEKQALSGGSSFVYTVAITAQGNICVGAPESGG
jgi:hypothetical protein